MRNGSFDYFFVQFPMVPQFLLFLNLFFIEFFHRSSQVGMMNCLHVIQTDYAKYDYKEQCSKNNS